MRVFSVFLLFSVLCFLLLVACSRKTAPPVSSMHTEGMHHKWMVTSANGMEITSPPAFIDLRNIYQSGACLGCRYFSFTPNYGRNGKMQARNISNKSFACDDITGSNVFVENLKLIAVFSLEGDKLTLKAADGKILFVAVHAPDDENESINRKWRLQEVINGNAEQLLKDSAYIDFTDVGRPTANLGCNNFSFQLLADNTFNISIKNVVSARKFCKDAATNESVFEKVLPLVNKYQVIGNTIKLFDKDDVLLLKGIAGL